MIDVDRDGFIEYDEFISAMDTEIKLKQGSTKDKVDDAIFRKLHDAIEYQGESLRDSLYRYERDGDGKILAGDLKRVLYSMGVTGIENHLDTIMKAGKVQENAKRIDSAHFAVNLLSHLE